VNPTREPSLGRPLVRLSAKSCCERGVVNRDIEQKSDTTQSAGEKAIVAEAGVFGASEVIE
jgi:hypothetical protein